MPQKPTTNLKHFVINPETPLGEIDTSHITTMADLFSESQRTNEQFEGISSWNVSQVKDMRKVFDNAESFNQPPDSWNRQGQIYARDVLWCKIFQSILRILGMQVKLKICARCLTMQNPLTKQLILGM